ncbi:P1 family peptidase [Tengunoibacter tsumagoiensis]|uniref:Peptidase S58 n=1 Tax=Tengunoibacter tsumagoiensis TaxID=2014871 RepID=A0A402A7M2_9CHLR|nr:P1 family peptidase [Tengunoibacter tsumagoiensis]GCE15170.1 peptidase S58 [Tengunoibacter tsumagoiensis]
MQQFIPQTLFDGPALTFDFPALLIGIAEYEEGPTGCSVFLFPERVSTSIDIRGGGAGTMGMVGDEVRLHAICFAGGSLPGLEVVSGVTAALWEQWGRPVGQYAIGHGASINDYRRRNNSVYPDYLLGRAAVSHARAGYFSLGARGAGRLANCGGLFGIERGEPSGQGAAFQQIGPTKIAVFVVVNSFGVILDRSGQVVRGNRHPQTKERRHPLLEMQMLHALGEPIPSPFGNTTLTLVVTNQRLSVQALRHLGRQVHTAMGRCIYPFHTIQDGDVLYAVTTNEVDNPALGGVALGILASELAWDAILASASEPEKNGSL